jgi:hypothetical protein
MASLENASIASSYTSLLKLNGNTDNLVASATGNAIQVVDGNGTASPLYLNTDKIGIGASPASYTDAIATSQTLAIGENQDAGDKLASIQIIGRGSSSTDTVGALEFINTRSGTGVVSSIVGGRFAGGSASDGSLLFNTKNGSSLTTKMTINDVGNVTFVNDIIMSGGGVNFPDDASTNPSSDVNTLDSYEEGTWTPVFKEGSNTLTFPSGTAVYTKVGNMVHLSYGLSDQTTSGTVSGTGQFQIQGLPFAPKNGITHVGSVIEYGGGVTFSGDGLVYVVGAGTGSNTILNLYQRNDAQAIQNANITGVGANSYFSFQISYPV